MSRAQPSLRKLLAAAVLLCVYAIAVHVANGNPALRPLGAVLAVGPVLLLAADLARRARPRSVAFLLLAGLGLLTAIGWRRLETHFDWLLLAQQVAAYLLLAGVFGASLLPGRTPLCTRMAHALQGPLDAATQRYTRQVTLAWALLLLAIGVTMLALYAFAPLQSWSLFANFGPLTLLPAMFLLELQVRRRRLPNAPRVGPLQIVRAWRQRSPEWR
jgi:uncharacterized membrane protein